MARYTHAILTRPPKELLVKGKLANVDYAAFVRQQEEFCEKLREAGVDIIILAPENKEEQSSLLVDDFTVVCNGIALMTSEQPGQRGSEVMALLLELGFRVEVVPVNSQANFCGNDVLFTGKEFFVALSERTNVNGAKQIASAFPEYPVTLIRHSISKPLKYYIAMAAPEVMAVGSSSDAQALLKKIEAEATYQYHTISLSSDSLVNCFNVNGIVMTTCGGQDAEKLQALRDCTVQTIDVGEMTKNGAMLSQYCLLLKKVRHMKSI